MERSSPCAYAIACGRLSELKIVSSPQDVLDTMDGGDKVEKAP